MAPQTTEFSRQVPAILGGKPAFEPALPFTQPTVPAWTEVEPELERMYRSGWLTKGPYLRHFEEKVAQYLGVKHAIGLSSCTSGLILGLQSLGLERGKGEIIVPSFSFMATFHAIWWNGFRPVFVDCEPDTFSIDLEGVRQALSPQTVAIAAVSVFGDPPDLQGLEELARERHLPLFLDSAHGFGTLYQGHRLGRYGSFESFSLSPTKLLTGGEGGLVATNDDAVAEHVRAGRDYGNHGSYDCPSVGLNARMSEANAIIAAHALDYLEEYAQHRNQVAQAYRQGLNGVPGLSFQKIREGCRSSYKDLALVVDPEFGISRDKLSQALNAEGIPNRAYFDPPGHKLSCYAPSSVQLPVTERLSASIICLPVSSHMELSSVERVCQTIIRLYENRERLR